MGTVSHPLAIGTIVEYQRATCRCKSRKGWVARVGKITEVVSTKAGTGYKLTGYHNILTQDKIIKTVTI